MNPMNRMINLNPDHVRKLMEDPNSTILLAPLRQAIDNGYGESTYTENSWTLTDLLEKAELHELNRLRRESL